MKKINSKTTMHAHSEAKVKFYESYVKRYLRILFLSPVIDEINIFDIFCGTGIYDNDKKGSPIVAFDAIKALRSEYGNSKSINLIVNDGKSSKVASVQNYIESNNDNHCNVEYNNLPAEEMFAKVINSLNFQSKTVRNLIFIDPYGYKEIKKTAIQTLLQNGKTEIILFLPISQMQRFTTKAVESDLEPSHKPLKDFVDSFFIGEHPIKKQTVSAIAYINYVKDALRFNESYYSTSYYIERNESIYYALFFISSHIYGFEKILEVKWQLDEEDGRGFKQPDSQPSFFEEQEKEIAKNENYHILEKILKKSLLEPKTNQEIYEIILKSEFLPKQASEVLKKWQDDGVGFEVVEKETNKKARKNSFYLTWEKYRETFPKVIFSLKQ
jgi:three-Cys-motif partner protein